MPYKTPTMLARALRKRQTPAEKFFWTKVRGKKIAGFKFNRQFVIEYAVIDGRRYFYIVDFYCHARRLIVELDGPIHNYQQEYDQKRQEDLERRNYTVLRFKNEEILEDWETAQAKLLAILKGAF